jgi:hypothetical protein
MDLVFHQASRFKYQLQVFWVEEWQLDTPYFLHDREGTWHKSHATLPHPAILRLSYLAPILFSLLIILVACIHGEFTCC